MQPNIKTPRTKGDDYRAPNITSQNIMLLAVATSMAGKVGHSAQDSVCQLVYFQIQTQKLTTCILISPNNQHSFLYSTNTRKRTNFYCRGFTRDHDRFLIAS